MGITLPFGVLAGLLSSDGFVSPSKEIQWLGSVFTGIVFCVIVSEMSFHWFISDFVANHS